MFISRHEKEELQKKIENLSLLATQASDRAQKAEEKLLEMSLKLSSVQETQIQQQLRTIEVIKELDEIEGLSDEITQKITTCDLRAEGLEKFFASRYRHYDDMDKELVALSQKSKTSSSDILNIEKRLDNFIDRQNGVNKKFEEQVSTLYSDQKMKYEKVLSLERLIDVTRGVMFGIKKDVAIYKKDFNDLCKIAVIREEPVFALQASEVPPVKEEEPTPTIKIEAPYGYKKDGTPRKRPGRPLYKIPEIKNEQPLPV